MLFYYIHFIGMLVAFAILSFLFNNNNRKASLPTHKTFLMTDDDIQCSNAYIQLV